MICTGEIGILIYARVYKPERSEAFVPWNVFDLFPFKCKADNEPSRLMSHLTSGFYYYRYDDNGLVVNSFVLVQSRNVLAGLSRLSSR